VILDPHIVPSRMTQIPCSLYIHFPWCVKKCPYCDFNSHALSAGAAPTSAYIEALIRDFQNELAFLQGLKIQTIFLGGGTPSLFTAKDLEPLFKVVLPHCETEAEITLEANPGTIERGQFKDYSSLGINRISLGVQSLNPTHLKTLGRIHNTDEVKQAVAEIHHAGFKRLNLDLMHGLPKQTPDEALQDLEAALALLPTHVSWYQLTIEPNTYFANYPPKLPHDDALADIEDAGFALLAQHGFERYEISAFAKNQDYCRHNLNYWTFGDYMGIGAGAHGKQTLDDKIIRRAKPKLPKSYLSASTPPKEVNIPLKDRPFEFMMNALRLTQGFKINHFTERTGLEIEQIRPQLKVAKTKGLLHEDADRIKPTDLGLRFLNDLLHLFA